MRYVSGLKTLWQLGAFLLAFGPGFSAHANLKARETVYINKAETEVLKLIREDVIAGSTRMRDESRAHAQCFKDDFFCTPEMRNYREGARALIRLKNAQLRQAMGLMSIEALKQGAGQISFPYYLVQNGIHIPLDTRPNTEYSRILKLHSRDVEAINAKFRLLAIERENDGNPVNAEERLRMKAELADQARDLYQVQVNNILYSMPYLLYLDSENPTDEQISAAFYALYETTDAERLRLLSINQTPLRDFIFFYANAEKMLVEHPELRDVYEGLKIKLSPQTGFWAWLEVNKLTIAATASNACFFIASVLQVWPVSVPCGAFGMALSAHMTVEAWKTFSRERTGWLMRMKSKDRVQAAASDLIYRSIMLSLGIPSFRMLTSAEMTLTEIFKTAGKNYAEATGSVLAFATAVGRFNVGTAKSDTRSLSIRTGVAIETRPNVFAQMHHLFLPNGRLVQTSTTDTSPMTFSDLMQISRTVGLP